MLHQLPHEVAAPIVDAYADSLGMVFLCAAPVALVGFIVALLLKEVPLREMDAVNAVDLGEGFGMPSTDSPDKVLEMAIGRMMRHSPEIRLRNIAGQPGCDPDVALLWALIQIYRQSQVFGSARLTDIAERLRVPLRGDRADFRSTGQTRLRAAHRRSAVADPARRAGRWTPSSSRWSAGSWRSWPQSPTFEGRPDREQVEAALERIAHRVLVQRDWTMTARNWPPPAEARN